MKLGMIITCITLAASIAAAQGGELILIQTTPSGATVYLKGDFEFVAKTPANLPSNLSGQYKTKITRPGYESWKGDLAFIPGNPNNFNIELKRKTRLKAGFRSLSYTRLGAALRRQCDSGWYYHPKCCVCRWRALFPR